MGVWDWIFEFLDRAADAGDVERLELWETYERACEVGVTNPREELRLLEQGRALAEKLGEPWWMLFFDQWRLFTLIDDLNDFRAGMEFAVQITTEAQKPAYARLPQRICIHEDFIKTFVAVDPEGRQTQIQSAIDFMDSQIAGESDCRLCLWIVQIDFFLAMGRFAEAEALAAKLESAADNRGDEGSEDYYLSQSAIRMCDIAFAARDWPRLREWAKLAASRARDYGLKLADVADATAMRALAEWHISGETSSAPRLLGHATRILAGIDRPPPVRYLAAVREYHLARENWREAWATMERELAVSEASGRLVAIAECRVRRVKLAKQLGEPVAEELAAARAAIAKLKSPQRLAAELAAFG